jgi:hypothetical protein
MSMLDEVIKIEISTTGTFKPYTSDYCVLVDATVDEVIECAEKYPKSLVFTFDTTPEDKIFTDMIDYTPLSPEFEEYTDEWGEIDTRVNQDTYKPWMTRLVQCLYIGNIPVESHSTVIDNYIKLCIGENQSLIYTNK